MPVIYRRRRPPPPSSPSPQPEITDADDSIVLSDLVRSGEASRLRRRGAIRENPSSSAATSASSHDPPPPRILTFRSPSPPPLVSPGAAPVPDLAVAYPYAYAYPPDDDDSGSASESGAEWDWSRRERGEAVLGRDIFVEGSRAGVWGDAAPRDGPEVELRLDVDDEREGVYMLFCGGESEDDGRQADGEGEQAPSQPRRRRSAFVPASAGPGRPRASRSNGCGALLHIAAHPRRKHGCWIARGAGGAADAVVGMDASYFEERAVAKMMRSACGCIREGVGCRACGNPLGTIYLPCQAAADGLFASPSTPPTPPPQSPLPTQPTSSTPTLDSMPPTPSPCSHLLSLRPSGPAYYLPQSSPSTSTSSATPPRHRQAIFTFLASHVRSAPTYTFPPTASRQGTGESRWFEQEEDGREWGGSMRRRYMLSAARGRESGAAVLMRSETMPTSSGSFSSLREREDDGEAEKPEGQTGGMVRPER